MTTLDDLKRLPTGNTEAQRVKWTSDNTAEVVQHSEKRATTKQEEDDLIKQFLEERGYDSKHFYIDRDTIRISEWQTYDERWLYSYKYKITRKPESALDKEELIDKIWYPTPDPDRKPTVDNRVIVLTDTHIGKSKEQGAGSDVLVGRWKSGVDKAINNDRMKSITIMLGGDLIEGYVSQNGKNISQCDLALNEQTSVASQLVLQTVLQAAEHADDVHILSVPGNHGESTRVQGTVATDSFDIMIPQLVYNTLTELQPDLANRIHFYFPERQRASVVKTIAGTTFCLVHGHNFSGGAQKGAEKWWKDHTFSDRPEAQAQILIHGHFHGFMMSAITRGRYIIQAPALETESTWFSNKSGSYGVPGVLSFDVEDKQPINIKIN